MTAQPFLTAAELASHLRATRRWVYEQVESHGMPAYRLGACALRFDLTGRRDVAGGPQGRRVADVGEILCVTYLRVPL